DEAPMPTANPIKVMSKNRTQWAAALRQSKNATIMNAADRFNVPMLLGLPLGATYAGRAF
ncbi:MAG TPA: hypothetical protein VGH22_14065, partial [Candidatus Binatia bacterium]